MQNTGGLSECSVSPECKEALRLCAKRSTKSDAGITCPICGDYLGPRQPLPHTLTLCRRCHVWVTNDGREAERHMQAAGPFGTKKVCDGVEPRNKVR